MKKLSITVFILVLCLVFLAGCGAKSEPGSSGTSAPAQDQIVLNGPSATYSGKGVAINGNVITITAEGEYHMTGKLDNGQLIIDTGAESEAGKVVLHLEGADISCETAPAIYVLQAKSLHIVMAEGTVNNLTSGNESGAANYDENANGGTIFAEDDIDIEGLGTLNIYGYINNGITCKDDVEVESGTVNIIAMNNGIKGSESVSLHGGTVNITAGNDGVKATSAAKEGKGFVMLDGGNLNVSCSGDGVSAETELTVSAGTVTVTSDGDPVEGSCKAFKGKTGILISGGEINASCRDHAIHSAAGITVTGGTIIAESLDSKTIAAHEDINISDGSFTLKSFDDALETSANVNISDGVFNIVSGNDGIHAGEKSDGVNAASGTASISGGKFVIDALDDPIDAKAGMTISGGFFLGTGTAKNPKAFSSESTQAFIAEMFSGAAGNVVSVSGMDLTLTPTQRFNVIIVSFPQLSAGTEYTVTSGELSSVFTARKE